MLSFIDKNNNFGYLKRTLFIIISNAAARIKLLLLLRSFRHVSLPLITIHQFFTLDFRTPSLHDPLPGAWIAQTPSVHDPLPGAWIAQRFFLSSRFSTPVLFFEMFLPSS